MIFPMKHFFVSPFFDGIWRLLIVLHHAENNFTGLMNCREQRKSFFLFTFYCFSLVIAKLITNGTFTFYGFHFFVWISSDLRFFSYA